MGKNRVRLLYVISIMIMVFGVCGCNKEKEESAMYKQIKQDEAKAIMDENPEVMILDVRTQAEYDEGHIKGAVCIPNETIDENVSDRLPDKDETILVYCRSGNRSKQASSKLAELGYTDIREFGGILTWEYEIEK